MGLVASYEGAHGTLRVLKPRRGVVVMTLVGVDAGEMGRAPFVALEEDLEGGPIEIFIDASHGRSDSAAVSGEWAMFFQEHRARIPRVTLLTSPRLPETSPELVRSYGLLEDRLQILTDAAEFERRLDARLRS
ncbi:MAG TPA: hypothetical protein VHE35_30130 [Kofleriaceae bacterium]|nr:hypothetical protein [Kofleriaceae bacterium]